MKGKRIFVLIVGLVASTGLCFTPAFADDIDQETEEFTYNLEGNIIFDEPDGYELQDESFGRNYQVTWVPSSSFTPTDSAYTYSTFGNYRRMKSIPGWLIASINLPSGAYLDSAMVFYRDNDPDDNLLLRVRRNSTTSSSSNYLCTHESAGTPDYTYRNCNIGATIRNASYTYEAVVQLQDANQSLGIIGLRLYWKRQIRTGLPHPFTDIGHLSQDFQDSIAALRASGITTGTSPTTYSPDMNVTRAQMAAFLARALGLYWDLGAGY